MISVIVTVIESYISVSTQRIKVGANKIVVNMHKADTTMNMIKSRRVSTPIHKLSAK